MHQTQYYQAPSGRRLAYTKNPGKGERENAPGLVFLGGLASDMRGSKASFLREWADAKGRALLCFDYSGHGESSGEFLDGCIGEWAEDARHMIEAQCSGPQIIIGSSMGGWIGGLLARQIPDYFAGFVGIAAAPDFTEDGYWAGLDAAQRDELMCAGQITIDEKYWEGGFTITRKFIEDGRSNLLLRTPLEFRCKVRLLHGLQDDVVPPERGLTLLNHLGAEDAQLRFVKGADHRFSGPKECAILAETLGELLQNC